MASEQVKRFSYNSIARDNVSFGPFVLAFDHDCIVGKNKAVIACLELAEESLKCIIRGQAETIATLRAEVAELKAYASELELKIADLILFPDQESSLKTITTQKRVIDVARIALRKAEQYMVTTNLERARSRGDYGSVSDALAEIEAIVRGET